MRTGLTRDDIPPKGYKSESYYAATIVHDFYASGDEVWELTARDMPGGRSVEEVRNALQMAMRRYGHGKLIMRRDRLFLTSENGSS